MCFFLLKTVGWLVGLFQHAERNTFPQPRLPNQAGLCLICTQGVTTVLHGVVLLWWNARVLLLGASKLGPTLLCND